MTPAPGASPPPIVFFDGVCGLCNRFVQRVLRVDTKGELRFAPLQGDTARKLLPPLPPDSGHWSVLYLDESGLYQESDAALRICKRVGGSLGWLAWLRVVPRFLRDGVYRLVARHRYRWFGKLDACPVPDAAVRDRMLP